VLSEFFSSALDLLQKQQEKSLDAGGNHTIKSRAGRPLIRIAIAKKAARARSGTRIASIPRGNSGAGNDGAVGAPIGSPFRFFLSRVEIPRGFYDVGWVYPVAHILSLLVNISFQVFFDNSCT